jgi:hypothetical protein
MWLVRSKSKIWGLALHGGIHLLTLLLLVGGARTTIWPQIAALALFHFLVDVGKYRLALARPKWVVIPYFVDQAIHILSLVVAAAWIGEVAPEATGLFDAPATISLSGLLIATHVWFVTEKTVAHAEAGYHQEVVNSLWSRMLARGLLLVGFLVITTGAAIAGIAAALQLPYRRDTNWRRALVTDILVAAVTATFVRLALAPT